MMEEYSLDGWSIMALTPATKYRPFNMQMMSQGHKALRAPAQSTLI